MSAPAWINIRLVLALQQRQISVHGGIHGVRDIGLLESALAKPMQHWQYGDPPPDIHALATSYAFGLAKNHPFLDGNKRVAHVVYRLFLVKNGYTIATSDEDKYAQMIALAAGNHTEESFADWLRAVTKPV